MALRSILLKETKSELIKALVPQWVDRYELKNNTPFLFLLLKDYSLDALKDIAVALENKKPGFFVLCSNDKGKGIFYLHVSPQFQQSIDLKTYLIKLQQHGFKGGGKANAIQGTGPEITTNFKNFFN